MSKGSRKEVCPHLYEMKVQSTWCCYMYNKNVDLNDCKKCKYGATIITKIN